MKNKKVLLAALAIVLALICAPAYSTPFDGTWFHNKPESSMLKITFLDNTFIYEWDGGDIQNKGNISGSFTYDARNKIDFQAQDGSKWSTTYKFNKGGLSLSKGTGCWYQFGDFYKSVVEEYQSIAPNSTPTVLEGAWRHSAPSTYISTITFTGNTFAYTQFSRSVNGRIIIDNKNVTLFTEDGRKWSTPYSVNKDKTQLNLNKGEGCWFWYGKFNRLSLAEYQKIAPNSAPTAFEGTWKMPYLGAENAAISFSGNSFSYTTDRGRVNGRFTNTDKGITFFADDGGKWETTYTFNDRYFLRLENGIGCFWWYGTFCSTSLAEYQQITPSSVPTAFEGTWKHPNPESKNAAISFSGNSFSYTWDSGSKKGLFTNTDKAITFFMDDGFKWVTTYIFTDRFIRLEGGTGGFWWYGGFVSKAALDEYLSIAPNSAPTVFEGKWKLNNATFTFSGNSFTYTQSAATIDGKKVAAENIKGRFIFDDNNITLITDDGVIKWTTPYTVSATKLNLKQGSGWYYWIGIFTKQK